MTHITRRFLGAVVVTAATLTLAACGGDDGDTSSGDAEAPSTKTATVAKPGEPGPPADYVRYQCTQCTSCRIFMGDAVLCTRPACKHHWKDHERPAQGS